MHEYRAQRPPITGPTPPTAAVTTFARTDGATARFPAGYPLRRATFVRRRDHLLVLADGFGGVCVPRFFSSGGQTTLETHDGVEMSRHMVLLKLNMSPRMERVLSELVVPGGRDF